MRLVGVLLVGFGATLAWYLGVKGEDLPTLRKQIFAFFNIADPGSVLPAASVAPAATPATGSASSLWGAASQLASAAASIPASPPSVPSSVTLTSPYGTGP